MKISQIEDYDFSRGLCTPNLNAKLCRLMSIFLGKGPKFYQILKEIVTPKG